MESVKINISPPLRSLLCLSCLKPASIFRGCENQHFTVPEKFAVFVMFKAHKYFRGRENQHFTAPEKFAVSVMFEAPQIYISIITSTTPEFLVCRESHRVSICRRCGFLSSIHFARLFSERLSVSTITGYTACLGGKVSEQQEWIQSVDWPAVTSE